MFLFKQNFVCGVGREQNYVLNNKYDQLLFFTLKLLFESELYITFQVIYMINIVFCFNLVENLLKNFSRLFT